MQFPTFYDVENLFFDPTHNINVDSPRGSWVETENLLKPACSARREDSRGIRCKISRSKRKTPTLSLTLRLSCNQQIRVQLKMHGLACSQRSLQSKVV